MSSRRFRVIRAAERCRGRRGGRSRPAALKFLSDPIVASSISVAGITAAGILSSDFFWMFQSLLGLSTRGTVKTHTIPMTLASVISLPIILTPGGK
ncbi:hypothetical protein ACQPZP_26095 [Spirillospora sp. CA-142024]|uniref:GntT/GntP/DsdX family permease n=1 Tax=Spirillospora sp. CA-142024 TaxID=3240036 RepID=UPI003D8E9550